MRFRSISFVVGLLLAVGAFVALLVAGQVLNPPPYQVVVVVTEVAPGATLSLDMVGVDAQSVDARVAGEYVLRGELDEWLGATVVEPLHCGQPLMYAHLVRADNPAAIRRLALNLEDESLVAMVIPVDEEIAPQDVRPGDRVDVVYGVGSVSSQMTGYFPEIPGVATPAPPAETGAGEEGGTEAGEGTPAGGGAPGRAPGLRETPQATPTPQLSFPMAKVCVRDLRVLDVIHEQQANPAYGGPESGEPATIPGRVLAIQVAVPREQEEMLHYAVTTGEYRVALLSPNATAADDSPTLGMTWDDLEAFFWAEREEALAAITDTTRLAGPGAEAIVGLRESTPFPTPVLGSTPVITAAGEAEATPTATVEPAASPGPEEEGAAPPATPAAGGLAAIGEEGGGQEAGSSPAGPPFGSNAGSLLTGAACAGGGLALAGVVAFAVIRIVRKRRASTSGT